MHFWVRCYRTPIFASLRPDVAVPDRSPRRGPDAELKARLIAVVCATDLRNEKAEEYGLTVQDAGYSVGAPREPPNALAGGMRGVSGSTRIRLSSGLENRSPVMC